MVAVGLLLEVSSISSTIAASDHIDAGGACEE
jgi:hypothetical protein